MEKLSIKAAAAQLGIAPVTLRAWLHDRRLPFYKVGPRRVVLDSEDIAAFLASSRVDAAPTGGHARRQRPPATRTRS